MLMPYSYFEEVLVTGEKQLHINSLLGNVLRGFITYGES